ncbi:hypothetical protein [Rhodococcus sp. NPDC058521]|uniref:hypothetical protein n=1 Tax=Rhodococcus sp. NPDC058521 TaxID=3346536 RepID=UPI00365D1920
MKLIAQRRRLVRLHHHPATDHPVRLLVAGTELGLDYTEALVLADRIVDFVETHRPQEKQ